MALTKIDDRGLKTPIDLIDDEKIRFGTGNDLELWHNGTNSYVRNNTGNLLIGSGGFTAIYGGEDYGEYSATFTDDGSVDLYYDGVKKLETTSWGTQVTGNFVTTGLIDLSDGNGTSTSTIALGNDDDLKIYHDASNTYITNTTGQFAIQGDDLKLRSTTDLENYIVCTHNGAVDLYYNGTKKLQTQSGGVRVFGDLENHDDDFVAKDNCKFLAGNSGDLQLYHDGSNSYIKEAGTGNLYIFSENLRIENADGSESYIEANANGSVELYYDGAKKLETSSTGATVTGVVDADAFTATADTGYKYSTLTSPNDTNIPYNTWTTISTNYGWSLPSAGTYLLSSSMRVRLWDVTGLIQARLYDNTNSSAVSNSVRMMWEHQSDTLKINVQITLQWVHTCTGAVTIYQQFNTTENSSASSIQNDANGANNVYWQRIG